VKDTLTALQLLAKKHRESYQFPVIGITGSNGKTIVKEWLFQLLRNDYNIVRSPKSYNSQVGVPLSVWQINDEHSLGIFEAGISLPNEMKNLAAVIHPQIGVFTNIGEAHAENFVNINQKIEEKLKLFEHAAHLIYCKDYDLLHDAIKKSSIAHQVNLFTWSKKNNADLLVVKIEKDKQETLIQGIYKNDFIQITIPFVDDASIENAIHCWCVMLFLGIAQEVIKDRMHYLSPVAMRLELKQGINNCSIQKRFSIKYY
jgi:alanine racemase